MWSTILIDINMLTDFKKWTLYLTVMIFTILFMKYSSWFNDIFCEKIQHLLWLSTSLPLVLGSSASKEISETMDLNEKNKINIGRRLLKWNIIMAMKTIWNGFKLKLVKPSFLGQFLVWNGMFDISAKFCVF